MSDVFISYARSTARQAQAVAEALRSLGYGVWRDDELPAHRDYSEVIEERLRAAKAVVVIWSAEAVKSQWVRAEADIAREAGTLVQLTLDQASLPMPFNRIQCADLTGWSGDLDAHDWKKVVASVGDLVGGPHPAADTATLREHSICVLPFVNMSGDPEQEYFSDGISEDIITDLSQVSALSVVARNTAFQFKGKSVDVRSIARALDVSHLLEGSVRKTGNRLRITAQLVDGAAGDHVWAERYDRDLTDIFALQDEISEAIVSALKLRLLPQEKAAIKRRGTTNVDAYSLYLKARSHSIASHEADVRRNETISRLCLAAVEIDPEYAQAWALLSLAQELLYLPRKGVANDGLAAADRALALDPTLAEPHAVKARRFANQDRLDEAWTEIERALALDPQSYEASNTAGELCFRQHRLDDAIRYWEKATSLMEADVRTPGMLVSCYTAVGDAEGLGRAARLTLERAEKLLEQEPSNGMALGFGVAALAALGEGRRARDWIHRALILDPDNRNMRFNFACALNTHLGDPDGALEILGPYFEAASASNVRHARIDPDLDSLRGDPRFIAMLTAAEARLAAADARNGA